ncbi:UDP-glucose dehydrogenase family protein [Acetivibrio straminisolvens]|jgi:UDPglucose 6-dehydrogenase|uniref:UDP-glucose 6-dehydrogenase n=1 Tax=Acetivibrio straminisolvens JCM 21531 TaxID=1294263 RepID=W4VAW7_9FIRM|nr:UDP-glucose/GDP-mannose dehydrogenase family protein [Acetivibrio straminisolvens]GAE89923.1 UDP-glucose dehydrogenase [Acetivibrio straminisolvens JCM 21531]
MIPRVAMFGTGYVGLVSGVCIADFGVNVICVDVNKEKIDGLNNGKIPIYEPGLDVFLERNMKAGRIQFTTDAKKAIQESNVLFIAVGTPPKENGEADMQYVYAVAETIGEYMNEYKVVVDKSTVPVGTGQIVKKIIADKLKERGVEYSFDVVSNPEFLREGKALYDFTHPDRVVIGVESEEVADIMKKVYRPLYINETPFIITNIETAEMIKYACNAFLATKITFINEIANLCEKVGANVQQVSTAMGRDGRISPKFLHAGPGFGGSCFPKDTQALVQIAEKHGVHMSVVSAVIQANQRQKKMVVKKLEKVAGDLKGKTIGILGLAFKPETDDMRDAPSLTVISDLAEKGAKIKAYDPQAMEEAKKVLKKYADSINYCKHAYDVAEGADALIIITEWHEFRNMDLTLLKKIMKGNIFYDARNIYSRKDIEEKGFVFIGTGI